MSYKKKRKPKNYSLDSIIHRDYLALKNMYTRKDRNLIYSGFYDTETWSGLCKCWKGYKIAKAEFDTVRMEYYAEGIRKFARQLGIPVMDFPQLGLEGPFVEQERESENEYSYWGGSEQVEDELDDYEAQMQHEQRRHQHSDYLINQEIDLRKAQMEYIKRNLRYFVDPGSFV
jgi:hypothetical protein